LGPEALFGVFINAGNRVTNIFGAEAGNEGNERDSIRTLAIQYGSNLLG
jgi:hypothetical protein